MTEADIKAKISAARKAKGITMATMAKNMGVSRQTYSEYEKGRCTLPQLIEILEAVGLRVIVTGPARTIILEGDFKATFNGQPKIDL